MYKCDNWSQPRDFAGYQSLIASKALGRLNSGLRKRHFPIPFVSHFNSTRICLDQESEYLVVYGASQSMPRNDQITRQWHLLRRLEGSNGLSLSQLGDSIPDDYSKNARTVRRDLEALEAVGFPVVTERHNGQTRWRLIERRAAKDG